MAPVRHFRQHRPVRASGPELPATQSATAIGRKTPPGARRKISGSRSKAIASSRHGEAARARSKAGGRRIADPLRGAGTPRHSAPGFSATDGCDLDNSSPSARTRRCWPSPINSADEFFSLMKAEIMSPEDKQILKRTWAMVAPISDAAAGLFYDRLFTLDPTLKPLFAKAAMKEQRRKLMQAIAAVINGVDHLDALVPTLEALGRNHRGYGVTDRHYETVGAALLWTLQQGLKEAWTPAAQSAWTAAYTTVATVMRRAAAAHAAEPVA
jgi:hemoglobin-like flavoprotein